MKKISPPKVCTDCKKLSKVNAVGYVCPTKKDKLRFTSVYHTLKDNFTCNEKEEK